MDVNEAVIRMIKKDYENVVVQLQKSVLINSSLISFALGLVACPALLGAFYYYFIEENVTIFAFSLYVLVVHVLFHMCEFCVAAYVRPREAHPSAFMILHSPHYCVANFISLTEFFVGVFFVSDKWKFSCDVAAPLWKRVLCFTFCLNYKGAIVFSMLTALFYFVRVRAMIESGDNFGLAIERDKRPQHTLVTNGVYKYLRHPAYFGWFWRTFCAQLIIANPISFVLHTLATWYFFHMRIPHEEAILMRENFFGDEYKEYKKRTITGIPLIP